MTDSLAIVRYGDAVTLVRTETRLTIQREPRRVVLRDRVPVLGFSVGGTLVFEMIGLDNEPLLDLNDEELINLN
jgi:hypothetical protein